MSRVQPFTVIADLPSNLSVMRETAMNLWWSWNHQARNLFAPLHKGGNFHLTQNPIGAINALSLEEIKALAKDQSFLNQISEVQNLYLQYKDTRTWWREEATDWLPQSTIAYFSAEFGIHESLPIYSGGLGVLAGDHLKASSDLGLPLIGVGLLYYEGYFSQYLSADGWQQESYPQISLNRIAIKPALNPEGQPVYVTVEVKGSPVRIKAWLAEIGLIKLVLLDTNIEENEPHFRSITARLYGGDYHVRIAQEIVLGIGGLRVLDAMGIKPTVCHMNEGHSAFLVLEQIRRLMKEHHLDFDQALLGVRAGNLFTTHTMVPAGHDMFSAELMNQYLSSFARDIDVDIETILRLGRINPDDRGESFAMAVLAVRGSSGINAVSELHGHVSRRLWQNIWPRLPLEESPIRHITNGVHLPSFTSNEVSELFDKHLGSAWRDKTALDESWQPINEIANQELWQVRCQARATLVSFCRERMREQLLRRGAGRVELEVAAQALDPNVLTIGFARRFASYKRAALLLHDLERLVSILTNAERPVQIIFSGKAHPADHPGKELIAKILHASHLPELRGRFLFLEDYNLSVARKLVQGVDVWLNNPRRPLEASGTSGMKAAVNGALNMSVLDGWWCEAFNGENGWSIGQGEEYEDTNYQDHVESRSIYDLLEREIAPVYYKRSPDGVPHEWIGMVKNSIATIAPRFSASRMVTDYSRRFYIPLGRASRNSLDQGYRNILAAQTEILKFRRHWQDIRILKVETHGHEQLELGKHLPISVLANLGNKILPEEVAVEVRYGGMDATQNLHQCEIIRLSDHVRKDEEGLFEFSGSLNVDRAGSYGFAVRIIPIVQKTPLAQLPGLITWWE